MIIYYKIIGDEEFSVPKKLFYQKLIEIKIGLKYFEV